jgi:RNA-directed DNA polymerase
MGAPLFVGAQREKAFSQRSSPFTKGVPVSAFLEKVRKVVKEHQGTTAGNLILLLNPLIGGWARYHQHVVSKKIFQDGDNAIFEMLWQWARKRHHNKPRRWIKDKYDLAPI